MRSGGGRGARCRRMVRPGHWGVRARVERFSEPALLLLLREHPAHGYELLGLVTSRWEAGEPGPAKRTYELTTEGKRLLDEWAAALARSRERIETFLERYEGR